MSEFVATPAVAKMLERFEAAGLSGKHSADTLSGAETAARHALAMRPNDAAARALLARIHFARREWAEAIRYARETTRLYPEAGPAYQQIVISSEKSAANMLANPDDEALLWFVGRDAKRYPDRHDEHKDLSALIDKFVLPGWLPKTPPFNKNSKLLMLGSSFVAEVRHELNDDGHDANGMWIPEGLSNTYALRQFVEWCVSGTLSGDAYLYDDAGGTDTPWTPREEQGRYRALFEQASGFVITAGLAELWSDKQTGGVFWRGVPKSIYESNGYELRMTSVDENAENLNALIAALRTLGPDKPIVLALSPIPLRATMHEESCMTIDCVSKSILRVAIDKVTRPARDNLYYWPAYEMVRWIGPHLDRSTFGLDAGDQRQVSRFMAPLIADRFAAHYFA